jgi:hypothetical protein
MMRVAAMLYCPKCKTKYENGQTCPKCGELLEPGKTQTDDNPDTEAFLISTDEGFDADMVEGSLRSAGIQYVIKRHGGPAGFLRYGTKSNSRGVDFYVSSLFLAKAKAELPPVEGAKEIQEALAEQEGSEADDNATPSGASGSNPQETKVTNPFIKFITVLLFLAAIALVVFGTDAVMDIIKALMGHK